MVKLEGRNPGGSVKDRVALSLVEQAEADGILEPVGPARFSSSRPRATPGSAWRSSAKLKGYHLKVVLPTNVSVERRQLLEIWGAEIIESPGEEGSNGAVRMALRLAEEHPEWHMLYQYGNRANPEAHYRTTGPEIWRDCPEVTHLVAGLGTSGTLLGVGRYLKEQNPAVQVWAVEPPAGERVDGLRSLDDGYVPPIFEELGGAAAPRPQDGGASPRVDRGGRGACSSRPGCSSGSRPAPRCAGAIRCAKQIPEGARR